MLNTVNVHDEHFFFISSFREEGDRHELTQLGELVSAALPNVLS